MSTAAPVPPASSPPKAPIPSDPQEIERAIVERQARLAATVDELTTRLSPKEVARRTTATAQAKADAAIRTPDGSLRVERVAAVGAALTALLGLSLWRRFSRSTEARRRRAARRVRG